MRSLFTGDSLVGTCLGDSLLASCPRGDLTGDWVVFPGNLLLKTGMKLLVLSFFYKQVTASNPNFFQTIFECTSGDGMPTRRGHE